MRRICFLYALLAAAPVLADDFTGRALLTFQDYGTEGLSSSGFEQEYDVRLEKTLLDPLRLRLSCRVDRDSVGTNIEDGTETQAFNRFQPGADLRYAADKLEAEGSYDSTRDRYQAGGPESQQWIERITSRFAWRPVGLPGVSFQTEKDVTQNTAAGVDLSQQFEQGAVDYTWKGLSVSGISRKTELDSQGVFSESIQENQGILAFTGNYLGGRIAASASGLFSSTHLDQASVGGPTSVPTQVTIQTAKYEVNQTPANDLNQTAAPLPALTDSNLVQPVGISLGPDGSSYQNIIIDLGRYQALDTLRVYVRDNGGNLVPEGGPVSWDVYVSSDALHWMPVAGAVTSFDPSLGDYEVTFESATSRYFKAVSFGLNSVNTQVTEIQAYFHTAFSARERVLTDIQLGSGVASLTLSPVKRVTLSYNGLFNGIRQTSEINSFTNRNFDQLVTAEVDPFSILSLIGRYENRSLVQPGTYNEAFQQWTGLVRLRAIRSLDDTLELTHTTDDSAGYPIVSSGVILHTYTRFYPTLDLSLDIGGQTQEYGLAKSRLDQKSVTAVSQAQLTKSLKLLLNLSVVRNSYGAGFVLPTVPDPLGSEAIGLPPKRDDRGWGELYYRPSLELAVSTRLGYAANDQTSGILQDYHVDWYPFRGGTIALGGTYDQDLDSVSNQQSRRITLTPFWTINHHAVLNLSYTFITVANQRNLTTRTLFTTLTLLL